MNRRQLLIYAVAASAAPVAVCAEDDGVALRLAGRPDGTHIHHYSEVPGCEHEMCPECDVCVHCSTSRLALEEMPAFSEASLEEMLVEVRRNTVDRGLAIRLRPTKIYPII